MPNEISKELIRQIEIISLVYEKPGYFSENDLSEMFNESLANLRRDFQKIREMGIEIHSTKRCLAIEQKLDFKILNKLINTYLALNDTENIKNLKEFSRRFKEKTLAMFIKIVKSIIARTILQFEYEKDSKDQAIRREVTPLGFFKTSRSFIFAGFENDDPEKLKYYLIEKISNIKFLNKRSSIRNFPSLYSISKNSWGIYPAGEEQNVVLLFDKKLDFLKERIFINNQEFEETDEGLYFKAKLKISNEFISWIMGWGKNVRIISPSSLRKNITDKAKEIIKVNK
ncbi:MAG: transcriptional regulator [Ignavibacteria bacterium]|nr:transcriptional regulator [Ignavibacteria bacterium]